MRARLEKVAAATAAAGADWAVLTGYDSVCYATGHVVPIEAGPSPFAGGPTTVFVSRDGTAGVVAANVEAAAAGAAVDDAEIHEGFAWQHDVAYAESYRAAVGRLAARLGLGGTLAVEPASCPWALLDALAAEAPRDITGPLRRARAVKTPGEAAALQRAAEAAAVGQRAARRAIRPGRSELDVFADIRLAMESFAGARVAVAGDLVSGRERTAAGGGWPDTRVIEAGDPVLTDLAPRVDGYWGDSCAATMPGGASAGFLTLFEAARAALDRAIEIMRPGLAVAELDAELRRVVAGAGYAYPHHSGHSIGTAVHEWPRLTPYETAPLEAGMFLMVEPGAYDPEIGGARLEWMLEVTGDGCRPVAPFDHVPAV